MTNTAKAAAAMESAPAEVIRALKASFDHPKGDLALAWFLDTCCSTKTTIDENPFIMAAAEGRRQVWVALNEILGMNYRDMAAAQARAAGAYEDE